MSEKDVHDLGDSPQEEETNETTLTQQYVLMLATTEEVPQNAIDREIGQVYTKKGEIRIWDGKILRCKHNRRKNTCSPCGGSDRCKHDRRASSCRQCNGASLCEHNIQRSQCKECGGVTICEHGRRRHNCKECGGASICQHNKQRGYCIKCGGSQICDHKKHRHQCKVCVGTCVHGNLRTTCTKCKKLR